jgi:hypothetical protein
MSADLDALDRGVIEAGVTAAEALARVAALEARVEELERSTPQAQRLQYEADVAAPDLAASGFADDPPIGADRHGPGCLCPYCPGEDEEAVR